MVDDFYPLIVNTSWTIKSWDHPNSQLTLLLSPTDGPKVGCCFFWGLFYPVKDIPKQGLGPSVLHFVLKSVNKKLEPALHEEH